MGRKRLIRFRRGTAAEWNSENPELASGEPGVETDTGKFKIGNGDDNWNDLPYVEGGGGGSSWGDITGTLSEQTDLQDVLDDKQDTSSALTLGETSSTAYRGDRGKIAYDHSQATGNPHNATQDSILDGTTYKQYSQTEKTKLAGIASGATVNDTDANLKNRANHTGSQAISTVTGLQTELDAKLATANNLSEIVSPSAARYNIRVPMLFNAVCVYTTNVASLSGTPSATDGITPSNGENVLLVGQTTQSQNGVWTVNTSGAWTRPADFPTGGTIRSRTIQIASGNLFANSIWGLTATSTITIDTSNQVWSLIGRPTGMFPKLQPASGNWFSQSGQKGSTNAGMGGVGVFQAHPVWLARGTLDRIAVSTTAAAASTWRLGIYKQNPYALTDDPAGLAPLLDAGTVNMNATAGVQAITINQAIEEGIYWLAVLVEAFTAQPSYHCLNYGNNTQPQIFGIPENMSSLGRYNVGKTYGSLISPANVMPTFPSTSMSWSGGVPRIAVRYA